MRLINRHYPLILMVLCLMTAATLRMPNLAHMPPGVHYDEAANGVLASEIAFEAYRPVFITSYTGKEALFFYLAGGLVRLLGDHLFVLRLTAVFTSLLTIAATYWLGRELCRDRRIAVLAAALLAVSFWHLLFSRLGFRVITQPLWQAITVAALLRGYRQNDWRWLTAAGVALGLTMYTYLAARLFPALLTLSLLPLLLNRAQWFRRWAQTVVIVLVATVVALPLLHFFWQHPETFWVRITQVAPGQSGLSLEDSMLRSLGMLFLQGDPYVRFNVPARPLFDWFWGGLLLVGWAALVVRWRQVTPDWQRAGYLVLMLGPLIMMLPTALATNEIVPSNLRAMGLIPFVFYLPAIGLMTLLSDLHQRFTRPQPTLAALTMTVLVLIGGGLYTERLYFRQWGTLPDVFWETDGDLTAVAHYLNTTDTTHKQIYIASPHYQHPTLAYLSAKYGQVKWLPQSQALVFPETGTAVYIYPHKSPLPAWAAPYFAGALPLASPLTPEGNPVYVAYEMTQTPPLTISQPHLAHFGQSITLLGYDTGEGAVNQTLPLTLYWRVNQAQAGDFTPFVHLEDAWGRRWSQVETFAYPSAQWVPGETIVQRVDLPIPPGAPPGDYTLRVGLFGGAAGGQLPRLDEHGRYAGSAILIKNVPVRAAGLPDDLPAPPFTLEQEIRPHLRLLGFARGGPEAATDEPYGLALWWLATRPISTTVTQIALLEASGSEYIITETQPVHNTYPFTNWQPPQFVIDQQTIIIPATVPAGEYQLVARFLDERGDISKRVNLGPLTVHTTQRLFTPPQFATAVNAVFGNEIELLGYSLNATSEAGKYTLNLIWQAIDKPKADYTVFVHLLQPDGACTPCAWQQDTMPQQGQYPTTRWLPGEVVIDTYQIVLPEGAALDAHPLEVGLYMAENGRRLQATRPDSPSSEAVYLEPISH